MEAHKLATSIKHAQPFIRDIISIMILRYVSATHTLAHRDSLPALMCQDVIPMLIPNSLNL